MGKLKISDDLKNKLDSVLSIKSKDLDISNELAVGPAPKMVIHEPRRHRSPSPLLPPPPPPEFDDDDEEIYVRKKKGINFENISYFELTKIVFITSVIGGIGLTLGIKFGKIIFYS